MQIVHKSLATTEQKIEAFPTRMALDTKNQAFNALL
jgi:hypothetical protein